MSYLYDKLNSIQFEFNQKIERVINEMTEVTPEELGLDRRSAYRLYIDDEYIAVQKSSDLRTLLYYGGFEYVDECYVQELGNYVFYHAEDERVAEHLAIFFEDEETDA